jgi:hypothetical protein
MQRLESAGAVRLSVDELVHARHGRYDVDYPERDCFAREAPVVAEVRERLIQLVTAGRDVVLDHGLWLRSARQEWKKLVEEAGGRWRLLHSLSPARSCCGVWRTVTGATTPKRWLSRNRRWATSTPGSSLLVMRARRSSSPAGSDPSPILKAASS